MPAVEAAGQARDSRLRATGLGLAMPEVDSAVGQGECMRGSDETRAEGDEARRGQEGHEDVYVLRDGNTRSYLCAVAVREVPRKVEMIY